jgi:hypothetical protein
VDDFWRSFAVRAATFDEVLSSEFDAAKGKKADAGPAAQRLAAWCRSSASGDWNLFEKRLARDDLTLAQVLTRFGSAQPQNGSTPPNWLRDAPWVLSAFEEARAPLSPEQLDELPPFGDLLDPLVRAAESRLELPPDFTLALTPSALHCLRRSLFRTLSEFLCPALYERSRGH